MAAIVFSDYGNASVEKQVLCYGSAAGRAAAHSRRRFMYLAGRAKVSSLTRRSERRGLWLVCLTAIVAGAAALAAAGVSRPAWAVHIPPRALCRDAHWQGKDLSQVWFAQADCSGAQLQGARLIGANFRGANLANAQLQEVTAWYANFDLAYLGKVNLAHADLARASFRQTTLVNANLQHAILKSCNMTQANLLGATLFGANLAGANLQGAILTGARLDGVDLARANLQGADLSRADLSSARGLTAAQLKLANTDSGTRLPKGIDMAAPLSQ